MLKIQIDNEVIYKRIKEHYNGVWTPYESYLYNAGHINGLEDMESNLLIQNFKTLNVSEYIRHNLGIPNNIEIK